MHLLVVVAVVAYLEVEAGYAVGCLGVEALGEGGVDGSGQCVEGVALYAVAVATVAGGACHPDVAPHEVGDVAALGGLEGSYAVEELIAGVAAYGKHGVGLQKLVAVDGGIKPFVAGSPDVAYGGQLGGFVVGDAVAHGGVEEVLFVYPSLYVGGLIGLEHLEGAVGVVAVASVAGKLKHILEAGDLAHVVEVAASEMMIFPGIILEQREVAVYALQHLQHALVLGGGVVGQGGTAENALAPVEAIVHIGGAPCVNILLIVGVDVAVRTLTGHHSLHYATATVDEQGVVKQETEASEAVGVVGCLLVVPPAALVGVGPSAAKLSEIFPYLSCHASGSKGCPVTEPAFGLDFAHIEGGIGDFGLGCSRLILGGAVGCCK